MPRISELLDRIKQAVIFAACFTISAQGAYWLRDNILDQTVYWSVEHPLTQQQGVLKVENEDALHKCEPMTAYGLRKSQFAGRAESIRGLILVQIVDGQRREVEEIVSHAQPIALVPSEGIVYFNFNLPCDLSVGTYLWRGVVVFKVGDATKSYNWSTDEFSVVEREVVVVEKIVEKPIVPLAEVVHELAKLEALKLQKEQGL